MTTITTSYKRDKESSIVEDAHYDKDHKIMTITFKTGGHRYQYKNIEEDLFEQIASAPSIGVFLIRNVFTNRDHKFEIIK